LSGIDIHADSVFEAHRLLENEGLSHHVLAGDFFDAEPTADYDAVLGNPPYVRYQTFAGQARTRAQAAAGRAGVRLDGLASSWAAFVVHATGFLKPNGRLALVLPAELLFANYAQQVRRFLVKRFGSIRLVMFRQLVFPDVLEEVVLLLAEGKGPAVSCELIELEDSGVLESADVMQMTRRSIDLESNERWVTALVPDEAVEACARLVTAGDFVPLSEWGSIDLGMVTGRNSYFALTSQQRECLGLRERDLLRICPPGSRHLKGLAFSDRAWREIVRDGARGYLFYPTHPLSEEAGAYVKQGEDELVHTGYKCRNRKPWWSVPLVEPPDLFLTYMNHETPRLVTNSARVRHLNSVHGVHLEGNLKPLGSSSLPAAAMNSVTRLSSEVVGRAYGGGLLKVEPREASRLLVPSPDLLRRASAEIEPRIPQFAQSLRSARLTSIVRQIDQILLGMLSPQLVASIREVREWFFDRRQARASMRVP
jgi:adenine-specific DNA methylase